MANAAATPTSCSVIANLELKLGHTAIAPGKLNTLTSTARFIAELANLHAPEQISPTSVNRAFAHKGGVHVSAVLKDSATYEHIQPETDRQSAARIAQRSLRPRQRVLQTESARPGRSPDDDARRELLERIKLMEYQGYELEAAEGTFELMVREALNPGLQLFELVGFEVTTRMSSNKDAQTTATVTLKAQDSIRSATATGHGPVNALDLCLRQCLATFYPAIANVRLTDYKVRVIDSKKGTAAKVRVLTEWSDHRRSWATVGVSENVIEASWQALVDAIRLELMRLTEKDEASQQSVEDYSWGV